VVSIGFFKRSTFVGSEWSFSFSEGFQYQILSITLFSYLNSWERASISLFNVQC